MFPLHRVFYCCCFFVFCCFGILLFFDFWRPIKNISEKMEIPKTAEMKNAEKMDILTRAVSTVVFTNSVFFLLCVSLSFACFAGSTIKIRASATKKNKKATHFIS